MADCTGLPHYRNLGVNLLQIYTNDLDFKLFEKLLNCLKTTPDQKRNAKYETCFSLFDFSFYFLIKLGFQVMGNKTFYWEGLCFP